MTRIYSEYTYFVTLPDKFLAGWTDMCPVCRSWSFVADGILEGFDKEQFPKEAIKQKIILR